MSMKGYCYIALAIGFFIFYQQNPVYAFVIIGVFIVGYLLFKSRKSGLGGSRFLKGQSSQSTNNMDDLITLMILQQITNNSNSELRKLEEHNDTEHEHYIEKMKQEALSLLDK
ncbi:MAG: hypothetical protein ACFFE4_05725 [Candidatus Thorarchaeota archaeon]